MQYMTATQAKNSFGVLIDTAQKHPITIKKQSRNYAVVLSFEEYKEYKNLQKLKLRKDRATKMKNLFDETSQHAAALGIKQEDIDAETL